ncbi:TetR/AcrR family transcriptional regulator [Umezawaea endophytica]|uniref:TetR/AcrR family transcriptional regulator n=1 Tax=Umezawaea endophytica TaxID=1654476 RepID=A0A9X3A4T8_9PSEU|nr:TetR/AcrR family transcriptional regulator [Umezawaea endophytica]MCS7481603.1 TetR/AcrR family transcriptional regulator [Umezawaea endophytica]
MVDKARDPVFDSVWLAERKPSSAQASPLSREAIVTAAVEALDVDGLAALSMRKLATRLGVAPMSLYWHVPTKDAVLELAMDEVFGEIGAPDLDRAWTDEVRKLMGQVRLLFQRHPWLPQVLGSYPNIGPNAVALAESMITVLSGTGLPVVEVSRASSTVISFVVGFAASEVRWAEETTAPRRPDQEWTAALVERYRERFPLFTAQFDLPELWEADAQFDYGLDCVIAGVETRTGQPRR